MKINDAIRRRKAMISELKDKRETMLKKVSLMDLKGYGYFEPIFRDAIFGFFNPRIEKLNNELVALEEVKPFHE
jgi:hypothetical protein